MATIMKLTVDGIAEKMEGHLREALVRSTATLLKPEPLVDVLKDLQARETLTLWCSDELVSGRSRNKACRMEARVTRKRRRRDPRSPLARPGRQFFCSRITAAPEAESDDGHGVAHRRLQAVGEQAHVCGCNAYRAALH